MAQLRPKTYGEAGHRMASVASGALAGICVVLLAAILDLNPHPLDTPLRTALWCLAGALPALALSAVLAYIQVAKVLGYLLLCVGAGGLEVVICLVLYHLDSTAGWIFILATTACGFVVSVLGSHVRHKLNQLRVTAPRP